MFIFVISNLYIYVNVVCTSALYYVLAVNRASFAPRPAGLGWGFYSRVVFKPVVKGLEGRSDKKQLKSLGLFSLGKRGLAVPQLSLHLARGLGGAEWQQDRRTWNEPVSG